MPLSNPTPAVSAAREQLAHDRAAHARRRAADARRKPGVMRASGMRIEPSSSADALRAITGHRQSWQAHAFGYRDRIGELRYALQFRARAISRVNFHIAMIVDDDDEPVAVSLRNDDDTEKAARITLDPTLCEAAEEELARLPLDSGYGFTGVWSENWDIAGEVWLHGYYDDLGEEVWRFRSVDEVDVSPDGRTVNLKDDMTGSPGRRVDLANEELYRLWVPHPRRSYLADSALCALLDVLEDIVLVGRELRAAARSRIMANGILKTPHGLSVMKNVREDTDDGGDDTDGDAFMAELTAALMAPIQNEGDAGSVVPVIVRGDREDLEAFVHMPLVREDSERLLEKLSAALGRMANGLDIPPEILTGMADVNHWCTESNHRVYTKYQGWVTHDKLNVGDLVLALDHETGEGRWEPVLDIYRAEVTNERMIRMESRAHSSLTTPNHRWPIVKTGRKVAGSRRRWTTTEEGFSAADRVPLAAVVVDTSSETKWTDDFVSLVACYTSDGTVNRDRSGVPSIRIAKFDEYEIGEVDRVLRSVYGRAIPQGPHPTGTRNGVAFHVNAKESQLLFSVTGEHKAVHLSFVDDLTRAQCALFLEALLDIGDGVRHRDGGATYYQVEPSRLDAIERAAIVCGYSITRGVREKNTGFSDRPLHWIRIGKSKTTFAPSSCVTTEEEYTGTIWCPVTPSKTWFCQAPDGSTFFTGNTAWQIDSSTARHHIEPSVRNMADSLTLAYLRPALRQYGFPLSDIKRIRVWYDLGSLTENPNRREDAITAREQGAIGDESFRQALGFNEEDAPSAAEQLFMVAMKAGMDQAAATAIMRWYAEQQDGESLDLPLPAALPAGVSRPTATPAQPKPGSGQPPQSTPDSSPTQPPAQTASARSETALSGGDFSIIQSGQTSPEDTYRVAMEQARQLMEVDRALRDRIIAAAEAALTRALERAGSRMRAKATADRELSLTLKPIASLSVCEFIGRNRAFALGADEEHLLAGAFDDLAGKFTSLVTLGISNVVDRVLKMLGLRRGDSGAGDKVAKRMERGMSERINDGWQWLHAALLKRARKRMFGEDDDEEPGELAEGDIPAFMVRGALALVGGLPETSGGLDERGRSLSGEPLGGLGNGDTVHHEIEQAGGVKLGYLWVYGVTPQERRFDPHWDLEDERFASWTDPKLATATKDDGRWAWVGDYFRPGDHVGCMCDYVPSWAIPQYGEQVRERLALPTQGMQDILRLAEGDDAAGRTGTTAQHMRDRYDHIQALQSRFLKGSSS